MINSGKLSGDQNSKVEAENLKNNNSISCIPVNKNTQKIGSMV